MFHCCDFGEIYWALKCQHLIVYWLIYSQFMIRAEYWIRIMLSDRDVFLHRISFLWIYMVCEKRVWFMVVEQCECLTINVAVCFNKIFIWMYIKDIFVKIELIQFYLKVEKCLTLSICPIQFLQWAFFSFQSAEFSRYWLFLDRKFDGYTLVI